MWVTDRGFSSERNRRYLRQGENAYIVGEKLRSGSPEVKAAPPRQGRYGAIAQHMRVKEVPISETERLVICHNPEAATRDQHIREQFVARLTTPIEDTDQLSDFKGTAARMGDSGVSCREGCGGLQSGLELDGGQSAQP